MIMLLTTPVAAAGIQGAAIVLGTAGGLTDPGGITGTSLAVTNTGSGAVDLSGWQLRDSFLRIQGL